MGEVSTTFTSDDKQIEAAYDKLYRQNVRLQEQMTRMASASKAANREQTNFLKQQVGSVSEMVTGLAAASVAVGAVTDAYRQWDAQMKSIAASSQEAHRSLLGAVAAAGDLANLDQTRRFVQSVPNVTESQALTALTAVNQALPLASRERRQSVAASAAQAAVTGLDLEQFAGLAGEIADLAPKGSADDVADVAFAVRSRLGAQFEKFQSAKSMGVIKQLTDSGALSVEEALALGIQASAQDLPPSALSAFADKVTGEFELPKTKGRTALTPEELARQRFAQAGARERAMMLLTDPSLRNEIMGAAGGDLARLDLGQTKAVATELIAAHEQDLLTTTIAGLGSSIDGNRALDDQADEVRRDQARRRRREDADSRERAREFVEDWILDSGAGQMAALRARKSFDVGLFAGMTPGQALASTTGLPSDVVREFFAEDRELREQPKTEAERARRFLDELLATNDGGFVGTYVQRPMFESLLSQGKTPAEALRETTGSAEAQAEFQRREQEIVAELRGLRSDLRSARPSAVPVVRER